MATARPRPVKLGTLPPGTRVRTQSGTEATLLYANTSRARVRIGGPQTKSGVARQPGLDDDGNAKEGRPFSFTAPALQTDWGFSTEVTVIEAVPR